MTRYTIRIHFEVEADSAKEAETIVREDLECNHYDNRIALDSIQAVRAVTTSDCPDEYCSGQGAYHEHTVWVEVEE